MVGNARVGQRTDYDKLTLEVWTDGSILPEDAVAYAAKILKEQMTIFINFDEESAEPDIVESEESDKEKTNDGEAFIFDEHTSVGGSMRKRIIRQSSRLW